MRVLVMESNPYAADAAASEIATAGHQVVRCFERDLGNFPCNALYAGGRCPLDDGEVDVAVVVRGHAWPSSMPLERGAVCAVRAGVPLVDAGVTARSPFERWAAVTVGEGESIVDACTAAAHHPHHNTTQTVTPSATVAQVLSSLAASGRDAALVVDDDVPVGVVTRSALVGEPGAVPRRDAEVRDVMNWECVRSDPGDDVSATLHHYTEAAWTSLRRRGPCGEEAIARRAAAFEHPPQG